LKNTVKYLITGWYFQIVRKKKKYKENVFELLMIFDGEEQNIL
jgi:hypothetical protein